MADRLPGNGLFGWLGRQVGYVKKAVRTKPNALPPPKAKANANANARPAPASQPAADPPPEAPTVVYREGRVEEAEHPTQPGLKLRRTVIDEVIVEPDAQNGPETTGSKERP